MRYFLFEDRYSIPYQKRCQQISRDCHPCEQAHNLKVIGSNPIPATTFVITRSPSRSNLRDGSGFSGDRLGGRQKEPAACSAIRSIRSDTRKSRITFLLLIWG